MDRCFRLLPQNRELLSKGEVLCGKFCSVTKDPAEEQHQDTNRANFTASENHNNGLETIAAAFKASIRNSFADNGYGIFGMDRMVFSGWTGLRNRQPTASLHVWQSVLASGHGTGGGSTLFGSANR